ncbi:MAG: hypothetical protein Q4C79_02825 [Neisseria sp.]|nr:hypothetical protein [Neisseria sp.]MDO4247889.1 hypothetical protein [Neisseria sp.]
MLKKTIVPALLAALLLSACSYGHRTLTVSPEQEARMAEDSRRVQDVERAERAERRAERREEMMDEADAIRRAYGDRKIYIIR